jgi:type IV secretion system protein VirD4
MSLILLGLGAVVWVFGWLIDYSASWLAGGHPSVKFFALNDPIAISSWRVHNSWAPWRLVGASDGLSHWIYWATACVFLAALVVITIVLKTRVMGYPTWLLRFRWARGSQSIVRESHFARIHEITPLLVKGPEVGRVALGDVERGQRVAAPYLVSTMTVAPTGAGKTTRQLIPALLEWDGPAIAVTTKDDIYERTAATRRGMGEIFLYDVLGKTRWADTRCTWNPIPRCKNITEALRVGDLFASGSADNNRGVEGGMSYWDDNGKKLFMVCFYAAAWQGVGLDTVRKWVDMHDVVAIKTALLRTPEGWRPKTKVELDRDNLPWPPEITKGQPIPDSYLVYGDAYQALMSLLNKTQQELQTVFSTAALLLKSLLYPEAVECSLTSSYTRDQFLNGGNNTLYVVSPPGKSDDLIPFVCGIIMDVIQGVRDRDLAGRPLAKPLLVVLDEAANIAPLR